MLADELRQIADELQSRSGASHRVLASALNGLVGRLRTLAGRAEGKVLYAADVVQFYNQVLAEVPDWDDSRVKGRGGTEAEALANLQATLDERQED